MVRSVVCCDNDNPVPVVKSKRERYLPSSLKINTRADLFSQLGTMERAGLPTRQAVALVQLPPYAQIRMTKMQKYIDRGFDIAGAGLASGLFTRFEASLLQIACSAGSPAQTYHRLAEYYARRASRITTMKARLVFPLAVLVIADFVNPLPKLFSGALSPGQYLITSLAPLIALVIAAYLFLDLPHRLKEDSWLMRSLQDKGRRRWVPWFGAMAERRNARDFFDSLALLIEAGMPILQALPISEEAIQNRNVRREFAKIKPRIESGASFAEALRELSFVGHPKAYALIQAGEVSGTLPDAMFRYSGFETAAINQFDDQVAEWVPRIIYAGIAAWVGYTIIHSHAFMPSSLHDL